MVNKRVGTVTNPLLPISICLRRSETVHRAVCTYKEKKIVS